MITCAEGTVPEDIKTFGKLCGFFRIIVHKPFRYANNKIKRRWRMAKKIYNKRRRICRREDD